MLTYVPTVSSDEFGTEQFAETDDLQEAVATLERVRERADDLADDVERSYLITVVF